MFGRKKDAGLAETNLLEIRPVRTAGWTEEDDRIVVERALPPTRGLAGWLRRLSFLTGVKKLRLDALGTAVWRRLDGARAVGRVVEELREEFGDDCEPAEERLSMFLALLRRERLIGYPGWDDERIAAFQQATADTPSSPS